MDKVNNGFIQDSRITNIIKVCSITATNAWHRRDLTSGPLVCACRKHTAVWLPWVNEFDVSTITTINPTVQFLEALYPSQFYWFSPGQWPEKKSPLCRSWLDDLLLQMAKNGAAKSWIHPHQVEGISQPSGPSDPSTWGAVPHNKRMCSICSHGLKGTILTYFYGGFSL